MLKRKRKEIIGLITLFSVALVFAFFVVLSLLYFSKGNEKKRLYFQKPNVLKELQ